MFVPSAATRSRLTVDFVVAGDRLRARIDKGNLDFDRNPSGPADVVIRCDAAAIAGLANNRADRAAALTTGRVVVDGAPDTIAALQRAFGLT
jgi:SCP-2 sterol transfer family